MGANTTISWATHTFNPFRGCAKVSEGCANCYAEAGSRRNPGVLGVWGPGGTRPLASTTYMSQPYRWHREALEKKERARVFCGSLMDFFEDRNDLLAVRELTLMIAYQTNWLDWLFLTKRPQNIQPLLKTARHGHYPNEDWLSLQERAPRYSWWFGATVENKTRARERIDVLRDVPAKVRFLSVEPMLEPFDLSPWLAKGGIHWIICGGESGPRARNFDLSWMEEVVGACRAHNVPVFCKQTGSNARAEGIKLGLIDRKGEDVTDWPEPPWGGEWPREVPVVTV